MKIINIENEYYPEKLREIADPPRQLLLLGDEKILNSNSISIVGSRKCTEYGRSQGSKFAYKLAKENITIVSGMAIGIDSSAHIGAIKAKGKTIAVLGSGFNYIYPKSNMKLFNEILESGGTVITEFEQNVEPCPDNFRKRNRIISGISTGLLVIEAAQKSGTGITINYARKQKKPIFAIPSSLENKKGQGTNRLLKKDGILVTGAEDILDFFNIKKNKQISIDEIIQVTNIKSEYKEIFEIIKSKKEKIHINEVARLCRMSINEIESKLLMMELEELIENENGKYYKIKENFDYDY
jgi:DNA processing protein